MKIVVITGSPHKSGTTAALTEQFIKGAAESGHEIYRFDSALVKVHPCIGCDKCETGKNPCIFQDDMQELIPRLLEADVVVFSTPLYYHGYTAQLKAVIDRFHGIDDLIRGTGKKAVLLAAGASPHAWIMEGLMATYQTELRYLGWQDRGRILAVNCYSKEDIEKTGYLKQAYELGKNLHEGTAVTVSE